MNLSIIDSIRVCKNFYEVLGLEPRLYDLNELKRAYRVRALKVHPDKCREDGAESAFKRLSEAFECLSDQPKQSLYLASLEKAGGFPTAQKKEQTVQKRTWEDLYVPPCKRNNKKQEAGGFKAGQGPPRSTTNRVWEVFEEEEKKFKAEMEAKRQEREEMVEEKRLQNQARESERLHTLQKCMAKVDVEKNASHWKSFQTSSKKKKRKLTPHHDDLPNKGAHCGGTGEAVPEVKTANSDQVGRGSHRQQQEKSATFSNKFCSLCRQGFSTAELLRLHRASELHLATAELAALLEKSP